MTCQQQPVRLSFFYGETWELEVPAVDQDGAAFTPVWAAIRIGGAGGLLVDLETPDPTVSLAGQMVLAYVTLAAQQAFPPPTADQYVTYEVRGGDTLSRVYTLQFGTARVRPSLFGTFPWTPPSTAPALTLANGGYLRLASGGRLLLAA